MTRHAPGIGDPVAELPILFLLSTLMAGGLTLVQAAPMLACSVVVAGLLLLFLPETSQRELESISEESDAA